jgi:hypothetical protein
MNALSHMALRLATHLFAVLLGLQCIWLLVTEFARSGIHNLPTDAAAAIAAQNGRRAATRAAMVGAIRGDLWAEAGFTYADLMWGDVRGGTNLTPELAQARSILNHAIDDAPHESGVWLLRAGIAARYSLPDISAQESLKMSYYTGASEQDLIPLRLRIAAGLDVSSDIELRELISRDLRLLLAHQQKSAIVSAYNAASPAGKQFIEQTVGEIDSSAAKSLRAGARAQPLPD